MPLPKRSFCQEAACKAQSVTVYQNIHDGGCFEDTAHFIYSLLFNLKLIYCTTNLCALAPNPRRLRLRGFVGRRVVVTRLHREVPGAGSWLCVLVVLRARRFDRAITLFEFDGGIQL